MVISLKAQAVAVKIGSSEVFGKAQSEQQKFTNGKDDREEVERRNFKSGRLAPPCLDEKKEAR